MADKKDADLFSGKYIHKSQTEGEVIVNPQKIALPDLTTSEEQLEKKSLTGSRWLLPLLHVHIAPTLFYNSNCLPSGNPIAQVNSIIGTTFVD